MNYVRGFMDPSNRLTIVVHEFSVSITNAEGMTQTLQTNNK